MKVALVLSAIVLLFIPPAWAIPVNPYTYNVVGDLSIVGNNVCGPSPCTESLHFAFQFAWVPIPEPPPAYQATVNPESVNLSSSGPLAPFTILSVSPYDYWFGLFNSGGDEIDVEAIGLNHLSLVTDTPQIPPTFLGADLYACRTQLCSTDFTSYPPGAAVFLGGSAHITATAVSDPVPEPSSGLLLALAGLGLLWLAGWRARQRKTGTA
jgi:hypothetical protein